MYDKPLSPQMQLIATYHTMKRASHLRYVATCELVHIGYENRIKVDFHNYML